MIGRFILWCLFGVQYIVADFNFNVRMVPYITNDEINNCILKSEQNNLIQYFQKYWLWHLGYLNNFQCLCFLQKYTKKYRRPIRVAIIDSDFCNKNIDQALEWLKSVKINTNFKLSKKTTNGESFLRNNQTLDDDQKSLPNQKYIGQNFGRYLKKNHGTITATIIRHIAPNASMISIPIFNDHAVGTYQQLCNALRFAQHQKADIVHLGLKVNVTDTQELQKLLRKFLYVIMPCPNRVKLNNIVHFFTKTSNVITVASCNKAGIISPFCNCDCRYDVIMPGQDIVVPLYDAQMNDYVLIGASGTSFAAACMTGWLANRLQKM